MTGGKFYDYEKTIKYIINNYEVKNIFFQMSMRELDLLGTSPFVESMLHGKLESDLPIKFYLKFLTLNFKYSFDKLTDYPK